jgi:hypothetical protein
VNEEHCQECASAPLPGKRRCAVHTELHNLREAARREERRRAGACTVCGEPAELDDDGEPMSLCHDHRKAYAVRRLAEKKRAKLRERRPQK